MTPSPTAKSNRSDDPFANETTPRGDFRTPSSTSKKGSSHKKDDAPARDHYDVLLSGKDYWGLDTSLADDIRSEVNNTESGLSQNHKTSAVKQNRKVFDSDEDIAAPRRGNAAVEDLDEFERLESAASQSARPTPEYKLMKTTDRSLSSSSSSQMAQQLLAKTSAGGAAGHSRLLAQTLAKSKSEQTKRLERPSSTLKVDSASVSSATARQGRGRSTAPAHGAQRRTNSAGPRGRSTSVSRGGKAASDGHETETAAGTAKDVEEKLRSLEKELEHYRAENVSIKKLKKQQEQALAETVQRKEEVLKYLENERQRTLAWCAEQRAEVEKEKRAAAKQIRDAKQKTLGTTAPIKTQKAEIEALQATLEKTKATHDTAAKKWKTTENRLYALIHEHADHIENLEKQLMALEENRIALLEFIAQAGLRLPKSLRNKIVSGDTAAAAAASAATTHGVLQSHGGPSGAGAAAAAGATKVASGRVSSAAARQQALQRTLQRIHSQQEKQKDSSLEAATFGRRRSSTSSNATTASTLSTAPAAHSSRGKAGPTALSMSQKTMRQTQLAASSSSAGIADVKSDASSRRSDAAKAPPPTSGGGSGRSEEIRADGTRVVHYSNGTSKEVDAAGNQKVRFANGDQKYTDLKTGTVVYFYAENQTTHTTYADGVELLEFPNGQLERHDPGGRKEVVFPNGSKKVIHPDGLQESIFPDGVRLLEYSDGRREVQRPAGTVHT
eukprot:gene12721-9097_t